MVQCQCIAGNKKRCSREASTKPNTNKNFCWQHQKCTSTQTTAPRALPRALPRARVAPRVAPRVATRSGSTTASTSSISPPPEFFPPNPFKCEGFWDLPTSEVKVDIYHPKISTLIWPDKMKFVNLVAKIEKTLFDQPGGYIPYKGYSHSRIDNSVLGNGEYTDEIGDEIMCWPQKYVEHYIAKYNVMPTARFFNYIIKKGKDLKFL